MTFFEADNLRTIAGGKWIQRPRKLPLELDGLGTDTREDLTGKAFVAIQGDRLDGHEYLDAAVHVGARLLLVERDVPINDDLRGVGVVKIDSARKALARLAQAYRRTLKGTKVIAVTGSAGKTTTKTLIHAVLSTTMRGFSSPRSFNNDLGVPLTLLSAKPGNKFIVCEVGMNAPGEISQLGAMIEPDLAVITSVGRAHLGGLGSMEAIATEKASLLTHLSGNGLAIVNADSPALRACIKQVKNKVLFGDAPDADLRLTDRGMRNGVWWFEINGRQTLPIALPGKHNAINALAAVAVAKRLGLDDDAIARGLESVEPPPMRMTIQQLDPYTIYNDAYNANPESMAASLETFAELAREAARRIVILGDMLELGAQGPQLHREVGRRVVELDQHGPVALAIFVGELSAQAASEARKGLGVDRVVVLPTADEHAIAQIAQVLQPGDAVLIKASRGMGLERIVNGLARSPAGQSLTSDPKIGTSRGRSAGAVVKT